MSTPKFVLLYSDGHEEGEHVFLVNGVEVGRCDHDSAGWQGMADQRSMFEGIAAQLGTEVQEEYPE